MSSTVRDGDIGDKADEFDFSLFAMKSGTGICAMIGITSSPCLEIDDFPVVITRTPEPSARTWRSPDDRGKPISSNDSRRAQSISFTSVGSRLPPLKVLRRGGGYETFKKEVN